MARALMGLIRDRHGTWHAQRKVPGPLQIAVARVLNNGKRKQVHLKKSLGTKDLKAANIRATSVIAGFDRTIASAVLLTTQDGPPPQQRQSLNSAEIARMAEALYAKVLAEDEAYRFGGRAFVAESVDWIRRNTDPDFELPYPIDSVREFGWHPEQLTQQKEYLAHDLASAQEALARGDISRVEEHLDLLLFDFDISLDRKSASYRELATLAIQAYVRALKAIEQRNAGEPVETPKLSRGDLGASSAGGTLRDAFKGWNKERDRPTGSVAEYRRAVDLFIELHGDLTVTAIKKSHARLFREALQTVPRRRAGALLKASLSELNEWCRKHPEAPKVTQTTVNKQVGALQTIAEWAFLNGIIPEDTAWANPFAKMRVDVEQSERTSFDSSDLNTLFAAPVFTQHDYPEGGRGPAAFWLPLLALFNGARQAELAGLTVADIRAEPETGAPLFYITLQATRGKRLKTKASQRVIPVHPELVKLGFLEFVEEVRRASGADAFLFPLVAPKSARDRSGVAAYSKWFGRYLRAQGVTDTAKVFHSFRHGFKDALRKASPDEELRDALAGHKGPKSVARDYGAKEMLTRFGIELLKDAVEKVAYQGLELSRVRPFVVEMTMPKRK